MNDIPGIADVEAARARITPYIRRTPLIACEALNALTGGSIFVKAESLQRFGAFKARGAFNKVLTLPAEQRSRGLIAFSSGNHGQAVAGAAKVFGVPAIVVMPRDAPIVKSENIRALGAEIIPYDRCADDREAIGIRVANERGMTLVKPFDDPLVIAGQGTVGLEIAEDAGELDIALVPTSGGGLVSGIAIALQARFPAVQVYAVEPLGHTDVAQSLAAGERISNPPGVRSFCDALLVDRMGAIPFAIARQRLAGAIGVIDAAVRQAMRFAFEHLKLVLEPSGAIALAAALPGRLDVRNKRVVVIASGGNVDPALFAAILQSRPD